MSVRISTEDVPETERIEYWRRAISRTFVPCDVRVEDEQNYRARLSCDMLGGLQVATVRSSPAVVLRPSRLIGESDPELYRLDLPLQGRHVVTQDGREARLQPGDFTLYDVTRPFYLTCSGDPVHECATLTFPRALLPIPPDKVSRVTALPISGSQGVGALISSFLIKLVNELGKVTYNVSDGVRLSTAVLDLVVVALAGRLDAGPEPSQGTQRHALMARINSFIDQNLDDPNLSPGMIATAHQISPRYLHKLFADEGIKVSGWIRDRRLEYCRLALSDPVQMYQPVSSIGARWGFVNATHFSRVFRDSFGVSPREYRLMRMTSTSR
jgi:AraC-like DNA-binding protein